MLLARCKAESTASASVMFWRTQHTQRALFAFRFRIRPFRFRTRTRNSSAQSLPCVSKSSMDTEKESGGEISQDGWYRVMSWKRERLKQASAGGVPPSDVVSEVTSGGGRSANNSRIVDNYQLIWQERYILGSPPGILHYVVTCTLKFGEFGVHNHAPAAIKNFDTRVVDTRTGVLVWFTLSFKHAREGLLEKLITLSCQPNRDRKSVV